MKHFYRDGREYDDLEPPTTDELSPFYVPPKPEGYYGPSVKPYEPYIPYDPNGKDGIHGPDGPWSNRFCSSSNSHTEEARLYEARMKENQESFKRFVRMVLRFLFK